VALAIAAGAAMARASGTAAATPGAPSPRALKLEDCVGIALGNNPGLLAALEAEQAARWRYYQQRTQYNPTVTASGLQREQSQPPPLGGRLAVGATSVTDRNVTLNQTLYSFGRIEAGARNRRLLNQAARRDADGSRQTTVFETTRTFYDLMLGRELVVVARESVAQAQRQLDQASLAHEAGTVARFDVVRARTQLANVKPSLIRAEQRRRVAHQALLAAMGVQGPLQVEPAGDFDSRSVALSVADATRRALADRPDVLAQRKRLEAALEAVREARSTDHPSLSLQTVHDVSRGQRPPVDRFVEINHVAVALTVPLWDGGLSAARAREARAERRRIALLLRQLEDSVRLEVVQAISEIDESRAVVVASSEAVREADDAVQIAQAGYEQGLRTNLEVLDSQLARTTARTNLTQARRDFAVARARLARVIAGPLDPPVGAR
jgi:outer membrane protein TolC